MQTLLDVTDEAHNTMWTQYVSLRPPSKYNSKQDGDKPVEVNNTKMNCCEHTRWWEQGRIGKVNITYHKQN